MNRIHDPRNDHANQVTATPEEKAVQQATSPGGTDPGRRGGVLLGETDLPSAQRLTSEGAVLIDLRPRGACARHRLPAAIHVSDAAGRDASVGAAHWVLLYGGTPAQQDRLLHQLPAGQPALRVLPARRPDRFPAAGPLSCR